MEFDVALGTAVLERTRMAIGGAPREILWLVLRGGAALGSIGVAAGTAAAIATSRFIGGEMFGISALDPRTLATTAAALVLVALLASFVPPVRAARVDPVRALRSE